MLFDTHKNLLTNYAELRESLKIHESPVLDLKILIYCNADEIEKLQRITADSDKQLLEMMQQVKGLSDSNTALRQELDELKVAAQTVVDMVDVAKEDVEAPLALVEEVRRVPQS